MVHYPRGKRAEVAARSILRVLCALSVLRVDALCLENSLPREIVTHNGAAFHHKFHRFEDPHVGQRVAAHRDHVAQPMASAELIVAA